MKKAQEMYEKACRFRTERQIPYVLDRPPTPLMEFFRRTLPHRHHRFDKLGRPTYIQKVGAAQMTDMFAHAVVQDGLNLHLWDMEYATYRCREQKALRGKHIETVVNILDLSGLSMAHRNLLPWLQAMTKIDEDNYPEFLGITFIINAPGVFGFLWTLVRSFLDPVVAAKVIVLGGNYKDVLLQHFEPENLPSEYGGKCNCPGGCLPSYSADELKAAYAAFEKATYNWKDQVIPSGKTFDVWIDVPASTSGTKVQWQIKQCDIGIHIHQFPVTGTATPADTDVKTLKEQLNSKGEPVVPNTWVDGTFYMIRGDVLIKEPSKVKVVFDNLAGWKQRTIKYEVKLVPLPADPANKSCKIASPLSLVGCDARFSPTATPTAWILPASAATEAKAKATDTADTATKGSTPPATSTPAPSAPPTTSTTPTPSASPVTSAPTPSAPPSTPDASTPAATPTPQA